MRRCTSETIKRGSEIAYANIWRVTRMYRRNFVIWMIVNLKNDLILFRYLITLPNAKRFAEVATIIFCIKILKTASKLVHCIWIFNFSFFFMLIFFIVCVNYLLFSEFLCMNYTFHSVRTKKSLLNIFTEYLLLPLYCYYS